MAWWKGRKKDGQTPEVSTEGGNNAPDGAAAQAPEDAEIGRSGGSRARRRLKEADEHQRKNGHSRMFRQMVASLKDKDASVRAHAAWSLGRMGDSRAVEPLSTLLNDKDLDVRKDVAEALKRLGWKHKP